MNKPKDIVDTQYPSPHVITFGYAKRTLLPQTREHARMVRYASVLGSCHIIIFTRADEGFPAFTQEGNLFLYATNAQTALGMVWAAYVLGRKIIKKNSDLGWTVSGQDPLIASIPALLLAVRTGAAFHIQIHGDVFSSYFFQGILAPVKRWCATRILHRARKIRVVSERIKISLLKRQISDKKIVVVPVQADIETFLSAGAPLRNFNKETIVFLYVGRFSAEKGLELLLTSFAIAKASGLRAQLQLLGEGPVKERLVDLVATLQLTDEVSFLPWAEDVPAIMAQADVFCLASYHEGHAMVLLEAMAAGLPVITTDVGCAGEVVRQAAHGYIVPVADTTKYAEAMVLMGRDAVQREFFSKQCRETALLKNLPIETYLHDIRNSFVI